MRLRWAACFLASLVSLTACQPQPLEKALKGEVSPVESNTIITAYCQTCHIHRAFDAAQHVPRVQAFYNRLPYTATGECRACHLVSENTWGMKRRKTLWPAEVAQNRHADYERQFLKEHPELRQDAGSKARRER